jgi:hypothetical protein
MHPFQTFTPNPAAAHLAIYAFIACVYPALEGFDGYWHVYINPTT